MDIENFLRRSVVGMQPPTYPGPEPGVLRMDANTNLVGVNPAIERVRQRLGQIDLNQYPTCLSDDLRAALAKEHGVTPDEVLVGDGSDEILDTVCKAFLNPGDIIACATPSFVMYGFFGRLHMARVMEVPLRKPDFSLDVDGLLRTRAKVTFIASPNNPTGNAFPSLDLERLVLQSAGPVVIDEAYADFCDQDFSSHLGHFDNMIISRTFSKSHGLAGLRVGYGLAQKKLMEKLYCAKTPLTLSAISEAIAVEALADKAFQQETIALIRKERERLAAGCAALGLKPQKTDANFMLIDIGVPATPLRAYLRTKGILTRDMADFKGLENCIRVTVGRPEHNDRLVAAIKDWKASCSA